MITILKSLKHNLYLQKTKAMSNKSYLVQLEEFLTENPHATHEAIYWELKRLQNLEKIASEPKAPKNAKK